MIYVPLWCLSGKKPYCLAPEGQHSWPLPFLWKAKEAKHSHTNIVECTRCPAAHSYSLTLIFPPKANNWPPTCDAKAPMTAFGQHSMVPPFYVNRASVAPCARTAREAPSLLRLCRFGAC
jgi:hypothetical protein